jgi:hypothetical protein
MKERSKSMTFEQKSDNQLSAKLSAAWALRGAKTEEEVIERCRAFAVEHQRMLQFYDQLPSEEKKAMYLEMTEIAKRRAEQYASNTGSDEFIASWLMDRQSDQEQEIDDDDTLPTAPLPTKPLDEQLKFQARPLPNLIALGFLPWLVQQFIKGCGF